jgi:hypothetical protein
MAEMKDGTVVTIDGERFLVNDGALVPIKTLPAKGKGKVAHAATADTFRPVESVYKGKATLQLAGFPHPFTFGVTRARLILKNLDAIKRFADKHPA